MFVKMKTTNARALTQISLLVAFLAVVSQIVIPTPSLVPITLQVFIVSLIGYYSGVKKAIIIILIYVTLGAVGAPVFSSFSGGAQVLLSYTGGFIFGYFPLAIMCALAKKKQVAIPLGVIGVLLCHLIGVIQYSLLSNITFINALVTVSLPFLVKDIALCILAYFVADSLRKKIK